MEKVNEKWFEKKGWRKNVSVLGDVEDPKPMTRISTVYDIFGPNDAHARWEHVTHWTQRKGKTVRICNYYMFHCYGKTWKIENRISHWKFTVDQIESALKIVGLA